MGAASRKYQMPCLLKNVIVYVSCNTTQGEACSADVVRTIFSCPSSSRPTLVTHSLTYLLTVTLIVLDSKPSGLSDQTEILQNLLGS